MSPSSQLTAATANGIAAPRPGKQQLEADLAAIEQLINRIASLEARAAQRLSSGSSHSQQHDEEMPQQLQEQQQQQQQQHSHSHGWDEGSGERQSSSHGAEDGGKVVPPSDVAFTKERSAVGARMTVASSSSDIRAAGHKRDGDPGPVVAKKARLYEEDQVSEGSLSRRVGAGFGAGEEAENASNHTMSTLHSSEEASSQRRDDYELHRDAWDKALRILSDLSTYNKDAWVFNQPVQTLWPELVNYTKVIEKPMDLGTVRRRVETKYYSSPKLFARDVRLTFDNALRYNAAGSIYHKLALKMRQKFDTGFKAVERLYNRPPKPAGKIRSLVEVAPPPPPPMPVTVTEKVEAPAPVVEVIESKPEAPEVKELVTTPVFRGGEPDALTPRKKVRIKGINPRLGRQANTLAYGGCRPLSEKEKVKLSELVDSFPEDRMRKVVEIVKERHPDLLTDDMELDLDKLDRDTLFSLYRLAMNWQKSKNKVLAKSKHSLLAEDSLSDGIAPHPSAENIDVVGLDSPDREEPVREQAEEKKENGEKESSSESDSESGSSSSDSDTSGTSSDSDLDSEGEGEAEGEAGAESDKDKG